MTRAPASIEQQAFFVDRLVERTVNRNGRPADLAMLHLDSSEIEELREIGIRLAHMAPHEAAIRRVVTGR